MTTFPSNSNKSKTAQKITKAITDATNPDPNHKKSIGEHLVDDILIPNSKQFLYEACGRTLGYLVDTGMQILRKYLFDGNVPTNIANNSYRNSNFGQTNYTAYSAKQSIGTTATTNAQKTKIYSDPYSYITELIFANPIDASDCVGKLMETVDVYGCASIATLYDIAGRTVPSLITNNWGWKAEMFSNFKCGTQIVPGGYILALPKPIKL